MKKNRKLLYTSFGLLAAFVLWTVLVRLVDIAPIGTNGVGFATLNGAVHDLVGVHMGLYTATDWLGLVPILVALAFAALGLAQMIKRRSLLKVDRSILVLGGFYAVVVAAFLFFEVCVINYRPVLIEGRMEASYPSSTTLLVTCVIPTAMLQLRDRIKNTTLRQIALWCLGAFAAFMVVGRLISGVHWITDIIGGALLSAGLVTLYAAVCRMVEAPRE